MTDRLVVCFRSPELFVEPGVYLAGAHALVEKAAALGGKLISWGATVYAFELDLDAIQDGIELALTVVREASPGKEHGVGISAGPLETSEEPAAHLTLSWGYPLVCAAALARAARPGEVLVDPMLGAVKRGELLTVGSRVGVYGKLRLRGLLLDIKHPWRTSLAEAAGGIVRPALVGRAHSVEVSVKPGKAALVRAARGQGGTRLLEAIEQGLEPARVLHVTPHPFGEPLGALRRAMLRAVTMGHAPLNLGAEAGHSLDALLAGEGLDPHSSAELLVAWLTPDSIHDPSGALILDDAGEIDADTLEIVAQALASGGEPFRVVARVGEGDDLPEALASLPVDQEIRLSPLSQEDAIALAQGCTGGQLDEKTAARWATRGGRIPLGVIEAIREAVEAGEIVTEDGRAIARLRSSGTGGARPPKHWVKKRLSFQHDDGRRVLEALAALGGHAEVRDLIDVLRRRAELKLDADATIAVLLAGGWVQRVKPDVLALTSATQRDAILAMLDDVSFQAWHRAASEVFASRERPLAAAAATVHAILGGERARALELARLAAAATRAVGLESTALAFDRFVEQGDLAALSARNLFTAQLDLARAVPSVWPDAARSRPPPSDDASSSSSAPPARPSMPVPPPPPSVMAVLEGQLASPVVTDDGSREDDEAEPPASSRVSLPPLSSYGPPSAAVQALRSGDLEAVERLAEHVRIDEGRTGLAERLQAMAHLARGETGDAIRRLRDAADEARRAGSKDRCRAALALAVALGAANRHEEALLETLDALARAREMHDAKGEHACIRFLGQLAATVGHHDVAEAWTMAAEG
jgi:hypothetical protein